MESNMKTPLYIEIDIINIKQKAMKRVSKQSVLTILSIVIFGISMHAQSPIQVTGKVLDDKTRQPIEHVKISISNSTETISTDSSGVFQFSTCHGTLATFSIENYWPEMVIIDSSDLEILLKRLNTNTSRNAEDALKGSNGISCIDGEIMSVRGNRSNGQVVIIDGVRVRGSSSISINNSAQEVSYTKHSPTPYHGNVGIRKQSSAHYKENNEDYNHFIENKFQLAKTDPLSTFSLDVDAASYSNMRRMINQGQVPPADAIRIEELINYFQYDYAKADENTPVNIQSEIATCPWNNQHYLVKIGVKAKEIASENLPASNFVFLIDVSGSMYGATRLDLVKSSLKLLVNNLREEDRVAIVVYAGAAGEVLSSTSGSDKRKIMEAINNLTAGGSTAGGAGIELAYKIAERNFISNGNNRVILCTDGDFNVGVSSNHELENIIERKRKSGVFLTVLGYGMGNYKDSKMQVLAQKGNGNHAYIDNIQEANKVLVNEFGGTMHAVAKDVKIQVEFNPEYVAQYRLIGYESRLLNKEDFNDDTKDAGELGAGHTVTALYEIIPTGVKSQFNNVDPLKYQKEEIEDFNYKSSPSDELLTIKLRYKDIGSESSKKIERIVTREALNKSASADFNFIMSVAMFGQLLKKSDFTNAVSYEDVLAYAKQGIGKDEHGYRKEFIRLAESAMKLEMAN